MANDFLGEINLDDLVEEVYRTNPKATLWDVIVAVLAKRGNIEPYIIWILSDLPVIEMTAMGMSISYISEFLEMHEKEMVNTCKTWGIIPNKDTLDFDPIKVYNEGMGVAEMKAKLAPVVTYLPSDEALENVIINVDKYLRVKELLEEWGE
jgi:hypothetical protein